MYSSSGAQESWGSRFSFYDAIEAFPQPEGWQGTGLSENLHVDCVSHGTK